MTAVRMWGRYTFRGHKVIVAQQWRDPFGTAMVGLQLDQPGEERADGLPEAEFLREAEERAE